MIKEPNAWPDFSMELAELASIQGRFQGFKSIHVPQTRNKTACALAETAKAFNRSLCSIGYLFRSGFSDHL
ncbi:hypothetical protein F2Q69_00021373 [Brassica cretica]|uniref:RNase H type-1 domain-containing protein n=1 Tax=Brassica cretica TaxID=69181 RepID=A0A8S9QBK0_BRACR|nr:hypothetical protein F2Q69_00021373 [Brassica cretica]